MTKTNITAHNFDEIIALFAAELDFCDFDRAEQVIELIEILKEEKAARGF